MTELSEENNSGTLTASSPVWENMATRRTQRSVNCALLIASSLSTEKGHIDLHIEDFDVFFGDQHRMKGEEAEQQFNKLARKRPQDSRSERCKKQRIVWPIWCDVGRLVQARIRVKGGLQVFAIYFRHSEGWSQFNQARFEVLMQQTRRTTCPWLAACDTNMEPEAFSQGSWYSEKYMTIKRREEKFTAQINLARWSAGGNNVRLRQIGRGLENKVADMAEVEEFDPRPHKPWAAAQKKKRTGEVPQALPWVGGGHLPGGKQVS